MANLMDKTLYSGYEDLSEDKKRALENMGEINAYLSASSIPEASLAARERQRQQEASSISRANSESDFNRAGMVQAAKNSADGNTGPFRGKSMSAQVYNSLVRQAMEQGMTQEEAVDAISLQFAAQPKTISTPEGVTVTPGLNTDFATGNRTPPPQVVPKKLTEGQKRGKYVTENLRKLDSKSTDVVPSLAGEIIRGVMPESVQSSITAADLLESRENASEWAATLVFLRSGATARADEVERVLGNFFPVAGDDDDAVKRKKQDRKDAMVTARDAYNAREEQGGTQLTPQAQQYLK
jgi:hypothetical protein